MIPIPGRYRQLLTAPVDRGLFLYIVQLLESQQLNESQLQATIDQLSAQYYYISCDIEAYNIRKGILALEKEKYKLHSETNNYLYEIISHKNRISHVIFQYPDARLEEDSYLGSTANRSTQIKRIIEINEDKQQHIIPQQQQET